MLPLRFVPYGELGDRANVIVDGSPTASTRLTLSHWPGSPTPSDLLADLSAEIAFNALARPECFDGIELVSNNHFDQDGLASVYALTEPEAATARRDLVVDVARAGDFGTFRDRDAIRIAFAIAAFEDPARSPIAELLSGPYDDVAAALYRELLPRFTGLLDEPASVRELWADEDDHLQAGIEAIAEGTVAVEEYPGVDLAVVTVPRDWTTRAATRFTIQRSAALHPSAIAMATTCSRLLVVHDGSARLECRYESWVMHVSRPIPRRPDLRVLAERLGELDGSPWSADPPGALTPTLESPAGSTIAPAEVIATVLDFLATAPPAWDPFATR